MCLFSLLFWFIWLPALLTGTVSGDFCVPYGGRERCFWTHITSVNRLQAKLLCSQDGGHLYIPEGVPEPWTTITRLGSLNQLVFE